MSNNTKIKRLCKAHGISPREARFLLRSCDYNLELAELALFQNAFNGVRLNVEKISEAIKSVNSYICEFADAICNIVDIIKTASEEV